MPSTETYLKSEIGIFLLEKGYPNTGKSTAALSFPNSYVFDFDQKMPAVSLKHYPNKKVDWDTFDSIFAVSDKLKEFQVSCPYDTLIVDSITSLSTLVLKSVAMTKREDIFTKLIQAGKGKQGAQIEPISMDYYNSESSFFCSYFIDVLKSLWKKEGNPKHIIILAHIMEVESAPDRKTNIITKSKSILTAGRKPAVWIPAQFDDCFTFCLEGEAFSDKPPKRVCQTIPFGEEESRTTYNLPAKIIMDEKTNFYQELRKYIPEFK